MALLNTSQTLFVVLLVIGILFVLALIALIIFLNFYKPKHIKEIAYFKLNKLCNFNDYLLLNDYRIHIDDSNIGLIDHIVISEKYIIIVNDFAISGVLSGDFSDEKITNYTKKGSAQIVNPLNYNINLTKRLALFNDLSQGLIKGLVVVNNDTKINISNSNNQFRIIRLKDLKRTIKELDKTDVKKLREKDVVDFINYLNNTNR